MIRLALLLIVLAGPAAAHGTLPGGGGFYSGALHPFVALDHFVALLALGLTLGRHQTRLPLAGLGVGLAVGLAYGIAFAWLQLVVLILALILGGLLAANLRLLVVGLGAIALALGLAIGADTDTGTANAGFAAAAGTFTAAYLICLNAMALAGVLRDTPRLIVLRVAGSWILAIAVLVLALRLAGTP